MKSGKVEKWIFKCFGTGNVERKPFSVFSPENPKRIPRVNAA